MEFINCETDVEDNVSEDEDLQQMELDCQNNFIDDASIADEDPDFRTKLLFIYRHDSCI